jgi:hypothetical protein
MASLMVLAGCSRAPEAAPAAAPVPAVADAVRIAVDGAVNSGVSIAAAGSRAVVTWAATVPAGTNVYAAVSDDGGRTFGTPVRVNDVDGDARVNGEQPPRVAIGVDIAVAWVSRLTGVSRIRMARSADGGRTFTPAATAHNESLTGARGWQSLAIDANNLVHAAWLDGRDANPGAATRPAPPKPAPASGAAASTHAMHRSSRQDIFHAVWRPDGKAPEGKTTAIEARVATDVCFCCKTSVATAPDGTAYVAFRHIYPTNLRDMAVARSIDAGRTFEPPVRVSEDQWQINACPEDGPSIAVGADGTLHIAWPTLIPGTEPRKGIFYSYSTDRGRSFAPRIRVDDGGEGSRTAAHPQLAITGPTVAVVWDESASQGRQIRFAEIVSTSSAWTPTVRTPVTISGEGRGVYPAVTAISGVPLVAWTADAADASVVRVRPVTR